MRLSRSDDSLLTRWLFTIDRQLLGALCLLVAAGLVLSMAASPAIAMKKGLPAFYFFKHQVMYGGGGVAVMLMVSMLDARRIRRLALLIYLAAIAALVLVLVSGDEINGARRWLRIAGFSLQPSEFAKPAFVVLSAWALSEYQKRVALPALPLAVSLFALLAALLVQQPDIGQTVLITAVWGALFLLAGGSLKLTTGFAGLGAAGLAVAYFAFDHVRFRFDRFVFGSVGDNSQTDRAFNSFAEGGFFGRGPGEGTIKTALPDAHTDFIFAVVAEEYGVLACLALLAIFAFVVFRALRAAAAEPPGFLRHAITGLALLFGLQAMINIGVNIGLLPAKGMTLPFISAGGSSTIAVSVTCGMLLGLTRRRPGAARLKMPGLEVKPIQREIYRT
jgi:cell division protein FtsW